MDRSLLAIFSSEQADHLARLRSLLDAAAKAEADANGDTVDEILRRLHTLKGAARAVGVERTEQLTHQAEELLSRVRQRRRPFDADVVRVLRRVADAAEDVLAAAAAERAEPEMAELQEQLARLSGASQAPAPPTVTPAKPVAAVAIPATPEMVRVDTSGIDELIRESSQLLMEAGSELGEQRALRHARRVTELAEEWAERRRAAAPALRRYAGHPEFGPIADCLALLDERLVACSGEAYAVSQTFEARRRGLQERSARLYQHACLVRMTPAGSVLGQFGPMLRDVAQQEGKEVDFVAEGLETSADRLVLQGIKDSVMHVLRNAVSHGVETVAERECRGKTRTGMVRLQVASQGDRLLVTVEDDGRGLNLQAIEQEARARHLAPADNEKPDAAELAKLLFLPAFSTAKIVSGVSGRGMGLSVVQSALRDLRGEVAIAPMSPSGTRVTLRVPISISTQHVLLVAAGGHTFGFASSFVESLRRVRRSEIQMLGGREMLATDTGPVPLARLDALIGLEPTPAAAENTHLACAIVTAEGERAALAVDRLLDTREVVIKDSGLAGDAAGLTAGVIPQDDGTVAVLLNVGGLLRLRVNASDTPAAAAAPAPSEAKRADILVVDDSPTSRALSRSILEAHGYQVHIAVDGVDALESIKAQAPDLIISDVDMPRMTGFDLLKNLKSEATTRQLPVILITSLESREEQQLGMDLGAEAYIVKRKFDQLELLKVIRQLV